MSCYLNIKHDKLTLIFCMSIIFTLALSSCGGGSGSGKVEESDNGQVEESDNGEVEESDNGEVEESDNDNNNGSNSCSFSNDPSNEESPVLNNNGQGTTFLSSQFSQLLENAADIIYADYQSLNTSTQNLKFAIDAYCTDQNSIADSTKRTEAQNAFINTMAKVQTSLVHAAKSQGIGPGADASTGMELVYSWPLTNTCSVDNRIAVNDAEPGLSLNRRGLDVAEYLLFIPETANSSCDFEKLTQFEQQKYTEFNELSGEQKQLRRCNYLKNIVNNAHETVSVIKDRWDPQIGNFINTVKNANDPLVMVNQITDGMYYLADVGKEDKLAQPMGSGRANTTPSCGLGNKCPQDVESPYANLSLDNLINNVTAFQKLYYGGVKSDRGSNIGFDDWLITIGEVEVENKLTSDIDNVLVGLSSIKSNHTTLYNAVDKCSTELETFFDGSYQSLTRGFRDDFLRVLGLQPPQSSAADTD